MKTMFFDAEIFDLYIRSIHIVSLIGSGLK